MATAYVLINYDLGFEREVIDKLKTVEGISDVQGVLGAYDIVAKLESSTHERLREVIVWKIRKINHIRSTLTLLGIESQM